MLHFFVDKGDMERLRLRVLLVVLLGLLFVFALVVLPQDPPAAAAREFSQDLATLDRSQLEARTCSAQQARVRDRGARQTAFSTLGPSSAGQDARLDVSALHITTTGILTDTARVQIAGVVRAAGSPAAAALPLVEKWIMVKENGRWTFCGEDLIAGRAVAPLLIQPAETSLFFFGTRDSLADTIGAYPDAYRQFQAAGAQGGVLNEFTKQDKFVDSFGFWFTSYGDAEKGVPAFVNFLKAITGTEYSAVPITDLGAEGVSYAVAKPPDYELFAYAWRVQNVVLAVGIRAKPGGFSQRDARTFADKMQSHLR